MNEELPVRVRGAGLGAELGARPPGRIAVLRALPGLGDMLCLVPALRALRAAMPGAEVTLIGLPSARSFQRRYSHYLDELLEFPGFPGIPEVPFNPEALPRFFSMTQGRFDLALQMHGSGTHSNAFTALLGARVTSGYYLPSLWCPDPEWFIPYDAHAHEVHLWLALLEFLGIPAQGDELEFPVQAQDGEELFGVWERAPEASYVCLHPGATEPQRRWPAERFSAVGDELAAQGFTVVLTGTTAERELTGSVAALMKAPAVDLAGGTTLSALAALLAGAQLLICNDTGVSHLAAAVRIPSVVVFAASDPARWGPLDRELHRVVGETMPTRVNSCRHTPDVRGHRCLRDGCSSLDLPSNDGWQPASVAEVLFQAHDLLQLSR
ncbi:MAG: glycosyltransferase family 9 protein [Trueperaceae bacterium]